MMSTNNFSGSSPGFPARQQNSQYSPYVSPSVRQQGQRFNYHAPSPYPRPRSSASKPNPSLPGDNINYHPANNYDTANDYYYMPDQSYNNSDTFGNSPNDKNGRFNDSTEYGSPSSEYYSCNEESFRSPLSSLYGNCPSPGYTGTQNQQQYSPYPNASFAGSSTNQPGYSSSPVQQQKRRGFGQRRFAQGRNGVSAGQKRGAPSGFSYQGSAGGFNDGAVQNSPPAKKPRIPVRCETCNIDFTSDIPYKMHLAGAKHLKKVKSKEVLETMETQGQVPQSKDNYFYCEHCQVMANSSQQLQMHFDGTKHKNKIRKLTEDGEKTEGMPKTIIVETPTDDTGPKPAKMTKFYCDVCALALNSEIQLTQHLTSKRHEAKAKGEPLPVKKRARKFTDAPTNGDETSDEAAATTNDTEKTSATTQKTYGVQELGSSFVSGGVLQ